MNIYVTLKVLILNVCKPLWRKLPKHRCLQTPTKRIFRPEMSSRSRPKLDIWLGSLVAHSSLSRAGSSRPDPRFNKWKFWLADRPDATRRRVDVDLRWVSSCSDEPFGICRVWFILVGWSWFGAFWVWVGFGSLFVDLSVILEWIGVRQISYN